jgi:hypothetical protein
MRNVRSVTNGAAGEGRGTGRTAAPVTDDVQGVRMRGAGGESVAAPSSVGRAAAGALRLKKGGETTLGARDGEERVRDQLWPQPGRPHGRLRTSDWDEAGLRAGDAFAARFSPSSTAADPPFPAFPCSSLLLLSDPSPPVLLPLPLARILPLELRSLLFAEPRSPPRRQPLESTSEVALADAQPPSGKVERGNVGKRDVARTRRPESEDVSEALLPAERVKQGLVALALGRVDMHPAVLCRAPVLQARGNSMSRPSAV